MKGTPISIDTEVVVNPELPANAAAYGIKSADIMEAAYAGRDNPDQDAMFEALQKEIEVGEEDLLQNPDVRERVKSSVATEAAMAQAEQIAAEVHDKAGVDIAESEASTSRPQADLDSQTVDHSAEFTRNPGGE